MGNRQSECLKKVVRLGVLGVLLVWCVCTTSAQKKIRPKRQMARKTMIARVPRNAAHKAVPVMPGPPKAQKVPQTVASQSNAPAASLQPVAEATHGRDPFAALIHTGDPGGHTNFPPGIAGLQVATVQLQGTVKSSDSMVAVVANPQDRVYFLHDGDHIYDGVVAKISPGEITFQQESKDPFGRTVEREVTKRLYPIAGDAQ